MRKESIKILTGGQGHYELNGVIWLPDSQPVTKIIHVVHGMTEHIGRYERFAEIMTDIGVSVAGFDLRGHGKNFAAGHPDVASFVSGAQPDIQDYGWNAVIYDIQKENIKLQQMFPTADLYMMGFSLGSFLVRDYMHMIPMHAIKGVILMGTGYQPTCITALMKHIIRMEICKVNPGETTDLTRKLSFDNYNKKFKPNRTRADWLCSDDTELNAYLNDPLCRKDISADLFYELICSMERTAKTTAFIGNHIDISNMPVLLISGEHDAVGNMGKAVGKLKKRMLNAGMTNIDATIIPNARHDILHEYHNGASTCVIAKIINWLDV